MYPDIPILIDLHTHSISSGHHTTDTITDLARTAAGRGLTLLGITDHAPAMFGAPSPVYFRGLKSAPRTRFGIRLLYGAELNILDEQGHIDLSEDILSTLDYASAGIHAPVYKGKSDRDAVTAAYLHATENPYVKIIVHCDDPRFPADYQALVSTAKEHHVLLELNEASLTPGGYRGDTRPAARELLRWCAHYDHPIILGSDSHGRKGVGVMIHCLELLKECQFPMELVVNQSPTFIDQFFII